MKKHTKEKPSELREELREMLNRLEVTFPAGSTWADNPYDLLIYKILSLIKQQVLGAKPKRRFPTIKRTYGKLTYFVETPKDFGFNCGTDEFEQNIINLFK